MKKALIPALLITGAALVQNAGSSLCVSQRAAAITCSIATRLFWRAAGAVIRRGLTSSESVSVSVTQALAMPSALREDAFVGVILQTALDDAFPSSSPAPSSTHAENSSSALSIPASLVRHKIGRPITFAQRPGRPGCQGNKI
jgi:hypothetical protein